ncbi:MAG: menaquinone biosynthetic enzyme MqnA/MqnD family protein [Chthoniobacterales bacterium]
MSEALRIGCVKYLNARPLIHGWPGEIVRDHPAALCRMLAEGQLDVALVSSFEFLRNPVYSIVDRVAVGSSGPVYSVFVVHPADRETLEEIALDPASLTSANLLRCLLAEHGLRPRLVPETKGRVNAAVTPRRGKLLIGDQAIEFRQRHGSEYNFWDLGAAWQQATGLPFVFALWLIRPGMDGAETIADRLRATRDENLASLDRVIAVQADFPHEFCAWYYRHCLRFEFAEAEKAGLLKFRSLCQKHGILPHNEVSLHLV